MQWSKNQQQAIDARNRRVLVSAAAGSGKTAVLVGRIIERILDKDDPIEVNSLLIMTFTRAAARQMKERIAAALEKVLHEVEYQSEGYKRLKRQIALIDCANISTIDSFCKEIIVENLDRAELDPGFSIADENSLSLMKEDILGTLMEEEYEKAEPRFMELVSAFSTTRSDKKIIEYIKLVYQNAQTSAWPEQWYEKQIAKTKKMLKNLPIDSMFVNDENESINGGNSQVWIAKDEKSGAINTFDSSPMSVKENDTQNPIKLNRVKIDEDGNFSWVHRVTNLIHIFLKDIILDIELAIQLCNLTDGPAAYLDVFLEEKSMILSMLNTFEYQKLSHLLQNMEFKRLGRVAKGVDADLKERAKGIRDNYKKIIKGLQEKYVFSVETISTHEANTAKYIMELLRLAQEFDRRFHLEKQKKNQVDFGDLEHLALKLLYGSPSIAEDYREKFDEIYVDEYQDSNYVQEELIRAIEKGNVFMVGDVKQSIYGFRQAKPELFTSKYNAFVSYEGNETKKTDARIDLSMNFRSRATVLESINALFYRIMDTSLGGIRYDDAAALHTGAKYEDVQGECATSDKSEILLLDIEENTDILPELEEEGNIELEARMIAARIKELKETLIVRDDNGENRKLRYSDIVILLRSQSNRAENISEVLINQGIPAFAQTSTGYFDTFEIRKILAVLTIIDNPYKDIAFCAYLHSPMARIENGELALISGLEKKNSNQEGIKRLYLSVKRYIKEGEDEILKSKLQRAMEMLDKLRAISKIEPLTTLLRRIYDLTNFYDFCAASSAGNIRSANLDMLLEKASQFMQTGYQGVYQFVRYIENLKKYSTDYGEASTIGEFDDTVRIMTIHKSKGLEFPVCILANANKRFNEMDLRTDVLVDDELGIACKYVDTKLRIKSNTLKKELISFQKKTDNIAEELRVLYVAMTRAKEKLIITGTIRDWGKLKKKYLHIDARNEKALRFMNIREASSYLDWILMCFEGIFEHFRLKIYSNDDLLLDEVKEQVGKLLDETTLLELIPSVDEQLKTRMDFVYPYLEDVKQKSKISISELKRVGQFVDEKESEIVYKKVSSTNFGGARKGNLYHRIMELLEFHRVNSPANLEEQVQELLESEKISKEAKYVSRKKIWKLLSSPIGEKLKQADKEGTLYKEQSFIMGIPANEVQLSKSPERILIQGIIDAFAITKNGIILVDYKTDRLKEAKEFAERYQLQLNYYKRALEMSFSQKVMGAYIYSFELEEWIEIH